jgi:hypothetical protein
MKSQSLPNRNFGFLFLSIFTLLGVYEIYYVADLFWAYFWFSIGITFGICAVFFPVFLTPFTKIWMAFGELIGKLVSPIMLAFIFFILITPLALFTKLMGRDELKLKRQVCSSYWVDRDQVNHVANSFENQF